jgi:uncharacterized protein YhaN
MKKLCLYGVLVNFATFSGSNAAVDSHEHLQKNLTQVIDQCRTRIQMVDNQHNNLPHTLPKGAPGSHYTKQSYSDMMNQLKLKTGLDQTKAKNIMSTIKNAPSEVEKQGHITKLNEHLQQLSVGCKNMTNGISTNIQNQWK